MIIFLKFPLEVSAENEIFYGSWKKEVILTKNHVNQVKLILLIRKLKKSALVKEFLFHSSC